MSALIDELDREAQAVADGATACAVIGFDNPVYTCMRTADHGMDANPPILVDQHAVKLDGAWTTW